MDYEKKYKEALERAKKEWSDNLDGAYTNYRERLEFIFPELAESEDERIRKAISIYLDWLDGRKDCAPRGEYSIRDMVVWLEKQGEQKISYTTLVETGNGGINALVQGELSADKIEPKFKVGDWVVCEVTGSVYQIKNCIENLYNHKYGYDLTNGGYIASVEANNYHLWTIQDAKDSDVLEFGDHGRLVVGIVSYVNKTTGKVDVNCLLENNNFKMGNYYNLDTIKPHPATKEQCGLLFQKMHEVGYEWDADKKKLKKIEQKPTWSEEDEKNLKKAIWYVENPALHVVKNIMLSEWLKSLKDRVQPQPKQE